MKHPIITALILSLCATCSLAAPITFQSLLAELTDAQKLATFPDPAYTCAQASSYDRASDGHASDEKWFANNDFGQFIRVETTEGRKEYVMLDAAGPGAIVRIWSANPKGTLRVYLDGQTTPVIAEKLENVLGGKWLAPDPLSYEASKGWNLYLPIPYARHCKITCDANGFYFQVNYRTYQSGTEVTTLTAASLADSKATIAAAAKALTDQSIAANQPITLSNPNHSTTVYRAELSGQSAAVLDLPPGPHAVSTLIVQFNADKSQWEQMSRSCIIEATFDGENTVWCPVGDLFASGIGANQFHDLKRSVTSDGIFVCSWLMPYEKSARITLRNLGSSAKAQISANLSPWKWNDHSMHFHAVWNYAYPVHALGAKGTQDWNYVDVSGQGVYVGDALSIMNPVKDWWGEGDEKIFVDGEKSPSHFGTGTEDYYGYAWCWPARFMKPFHAQSRSDGESLGNNWGRTTVTRIRGLDAIPFKKSLSMNIEVWHWKTCDIEMATAAYFYARPGATTNRAPMVKEAAATLITPPPLPPPRKIAGAIECEDLKVTSSSPGVTWESQGGYGPDLWSGAKHLWVRGKKVGDAIEIAVPTTIDGDAVIELHATKSWDYGIVKFTINGEPAGAEMDLYSGSREVLAIGPISLGTHHIKGGSFTLRCELVGANPKSEGSRSFFGLDAVVVKPKTQ